MPKGFKCSEGREIPNRANVGTKTQKVNAEGPSNLAGTQGSDCEMKMQWFAEVRAWRMPCAKESVIYLTGNLNHHVKGDVSKLARKPAQCQCAERQ